MVCKSEDSETNQTNVLVRSATAGAGNVRVFLVGTQVEMQEHCNVIV